MRFFLEKTISNLIIERGHNIFSTFFEQNLTISLLWNDCKAQNSNVNLGTFTNFVENFAQHCQVPSVLSYCCFILISHLSNSHQHMFYINCISYYDHQYAILKFNRKVLKWQRETVKSCSDQTSVLESCGKILTVLSSLQPPPTIVIIGRNG